MQPPNDEHGPTPAQPHAAPQPPRAASTPPVGVTLELEAPPPPELLDGRYRIEALLGQGGMGRVFAARDLKLDRRVAVKLLHGDGADPASLRRLAREARAAGALQHPNILSVFDLGEHEGRPFIVTELLEGETLRARLAAGPPPPAEAARVAAEIARALAAAHANGLVHRDLKPENVFLARDGAVKLLDFGIAKRIVATGPESNLTASGTLLGTVGYMAPEQVRGHDVEPRTDVFAFGAVLYELLSGQRAFQRASAVETGYAILTSEPPPLPASALSAVVAACLKKEAAARPAAGDLLPVLEGAQLSAAATVRLPRPASRLARIAQAGVLAALLAAAGLAGFWLSRPPRPAPPPPGRMEQLASQDSQSAEAVAAFRAGEALLRAGKRGAAAREYQRAIAADRDFALASYRLAVAVMGEEPGRARDARDRARRYSARLPQREQLLLKAMTAYGDGRADLAEPMYRQALEAHPDDREAALQLGEVLFHLGPLRGGSPLAAEGVFARVLVLEPGDVTALVHLLDLAQLFGHRELALVLARRLAALDADDSLAARAALAAYGEPLDLADLERDVLAAPVTIQQAAWQRAAWADPGAAISHRLARALAESAPQPGRRALWRVAEAYLSIGSGKREEARALLDEAVALAPETSAVYAAAAVEDFGFMAPSAARLAKARAWAAQVDLGHNPDLEAPRAALEGSLALRAGDDAGVARALATLQARAAADPASAAGDLALGLEARKLAAAGRDDDALALLGKMRLAVPSQGDWSSQPLLPQQELRVTLLEKKGDLAGAARWQDAVIFGNPVSVALAAPMSLRRGRLAARQHASLGAQADLLRAATLWREADPPLRAEAARARAEAEALAREASAAP